MIEQYLRQHYQHYFANTLAKLSSRVMTANVMTLLACLSGISIAPLLYLHDSKSALIMLVLTGLFDTLDGTIARFKQQSSIIGTVFDIVSDRIVEFSIILGLFLYAPAQRALVSLVMLGSIMLCLTCFLVVGIFSDNNTEKGFHYSPGLIERFEAFLFFAAMILWPHAFNGLGWALSCLVLWTALHHIMQFIRAHKN